MHGQPIVSPTDGTIVEVCVKQGDLVTPKMKIAVLSVMKMETTIYYQATKEVKTVTKVGVRPGQVVQGGQAIAFLSDPVAGSVPPSALLTTGVLTQNINTGWGKEVQQIEKTAELAKQRGGPAAVKKQHSRGRLTVRERINLLLDKTSFREVGKLAGISEMKNGELESFEPGNFVLGTGKVQGRTIVVGGEDFTMSGGSPNLAGLRKSQYCETYALTLRTPLVRLHEGSGTHALLLPLFVRCFLLF
jgi:hypothetical protein